MDLTDGDKVGLCWWKNPDIQQNIEELYRVTVKGLVQNSTEKQEFSMFTWGGRVLNLRNIPDDILYTR